MNEENGFFIVASGKDHAVRNMHQMDRSGVVLNEKEGKQVLRPNLDQAVR